MRYGFSGENSMTEMSLSELLMYVLVLPSLGALAYWLIFDPDGRELDEDA